ncbi:MAG TPA: ISAzo13 family transposase [Pyrinomonadaceae bacterium]
MIDERAIGDRYRALAGELDERRRRLWAGAEALSHGRGGQAAVVRATGMSATTVARGMREIASGETLEGGRVRKAGGGRRALTETDPTLLADLQALVAGDARGDPESPLLWTAKSVRTLAGALREQGHRVSHETVAKLLRGMGYSLQANRKTKEGASHPDRDAQFAHINATAAAAIAAGQPVISVDTKKKELIGDFKNAGREWHPKGDPTLVRTKDFKDKELGKVNPYGIYDIALDEGYVSVGVDADTAEFAVASIASWWTHLGKARYPDAATLTITADCGGSNGNRLRLWKIALQRLADKTGLQLQVCHFPPGTSKWNKIEHRLFSYIARNWRGQPLVSRQAVVSLIAATTSTAGLKVYAQLDENAYERGIKITDAQLATVNLHPDQFHGEWNYVIKPTP